jgi:N-acetylglutamate synthase-like GNAT family acetyltransferase
MNLKIRTANNNDFQRIVDLFKQLWPGKPLNVDKLRAIFQQMGNCDRYELLCAENDGQLVGCASLAILESFWQEELTISA